jgi:hypothetical protein
MKRPPLRYLIIAFLLFVFAGVQWNDPDPTLWIILYGVTGVFFVMAYKNRYYRPAVLGWAMVSLLWALTLLPEFYHWVQMGAPSIVDKMKAEDPWIELTREFLGLVINLLACLYLVRQMRSKTPNTL